jgi:hypothetical protein
MKIRSSFVFIAIFCVYVSPGKEQKSGERVLKFPFYYWPPSISLPEKNRIPRSLHIPIGADSDFFGGSTARVQAGVFLQVIACIFLSVFIFVIHQPHLVSSRRQVGQREYRVAPARKLHGGLFALHELENIFFSGKLLALNLTTMEP